MIELKSTKALVKRILEQDEQSRNSDSFLYLKVLEHLAEEKGINLYGISIPIFLVSMKEYGFPPFESVRRARQKLQVEYPELSACEKVDAARMENEAVYRQFAREG